jgi:hypothetical protein
MRITESRIRQIIREEARRALREGGDDGQKHRDRIASFETGYEFGQDDAEEEDGRLTAESVIEQYKDEGPRSWMRVSNDFHEMAGGGMDDILEKYYPGLTADDCAEIADTLDRHFRMG